MKKVLFFSHQSDFIYGGEVCTLSFMRELRNQGVEVHFAAPAGVYLERAREVAICHEVRSRQFSRSWLGLAQFFRALCVARSQLREIVREAKIDIVHATSLKAMVYCWRAFPALPIIWHHHDILPCGVANNAWVRGLAFGAKKILVPSEATRVGLLGAGVPKEKTEVLWNGFRLQDWRRRPRRNANAPFRLAMVGEISERKGSDRLRAVLSLVAREKNISVPIECWVIGAGLSDPAFAERVKSEISALSELNIKFLGRREDVKQLYQEIDLVLVLSRQDPLPTVIVEAGLSGVPVVGTLAGGIPEMIEPGRNGFLAETDHDLAKAVADAFSCWENLSDGARAVAEERYDIEKLAQRLRAIYAAEQK